MKSILKLVLAVVLGFLAGSIVNMALIMLSGYVIPPPPGADMTTAEGIRAALPRLQLQHFAFPFMAHAVGTLVGSYTASRLVSERKLFAALAVAALFFIGGIAASRMIPAPTWFVVLDLVGAYFPAGLIAYLLARPRSGAGSRRLTESSRSS